MAMLSAVLPFKKIFHKSRPVWALFLSFSTEIYSFWIFFDGSNTDNEISDVQGHNNGGIIDSWTNYCTVISIFESLYVYLARVK